MQQVRQARESANLVQLLEHVRDTISRAVTTNSHDAIVLMIFPDVRTAIQVRIALDTQELPGGVVELRDCEGPIESRGERFAHEDAVLVETNDVNMSVKIQVKLLFNELSTWTVVLEEVEAPIEVNIPLCPHDTPGAVQIAYLVRSTIKIDVGRHLLVRRAIQVAVARARRPLGKRRALGGLSTSTPRQRERDAHHGQSNEPPRSRQRSV